MNRTEKLLWKRLKPLLPGVTERVENSAGTGMPDVQGDWLYVGKDGSRHYNPYWVELKVTSARGAFDPEHVIKLLRATQKNWLRRHILEGANIFIAVGHPKGFCLYWVTCIFSGLTVSFFNPLQVVNFNGKFTKKNKSGVINQIREAIKHG